ncbi:MAG: cysteine desulfurase family protein [Gemmatimonadota bacterium]
MAEIYLDNNATTPLIPEVREAMEPFLCGCFGNPSSVHRKGREAAEALERARSEIRQTLGGGEYDIVFTSGGTEANNLAIEGVRRARQGARRHFVATAVEHASVLAALARLRDEGAEVTLVPVDSSGHVRVEELWAALRPSTVLLSLIHVNNEVGTVHDVEGLAAEAKRRVPRLVVHVDGVQALGKVPVHLNQVDLYAASAHKLHGPKGSGFLAVRRGLALAPVLCGGGHEGGMRSGTQNVAGAVGCGRAVALAESERERALGTLRELHERLRRCLEDGCGGRLNSPPGGVPHTTNVSFPGLPGEVMLRALEARDVYVSTASACTTRKRARSHVLEAMGLPTEVRESAIRISLSRFTTGEEVDAAVAALRAAREELLLPPAGRRRGAGAA